VPVSKTNCESCGGLGFIEGWYAAGALFTPNVEQCPKRCNITGYSNEVQRRLNDPNRVTAHLAVKNSPQMRSTVKQDAKIIPFVRATKKEENPPWWLKN
jgi:hypothetical protein